MIKSKPKYYLVLLLVLLLASSLMGCDTKPPVIDQFYALPSQITVGEFAILQWSVRSVTETTIIYIDQGIGIVAAKGSLSVSPSSTIAYTLTATNDAATITRAVVITVKPPTSTPLSIPPSDEVISALDTDELLKIGYNHPEKEVIVEGIIVQAYYAKDSRWQQIFLDFHDPCRGYFTVIIWGSNGANFPLNPESYYLRKKVRVKGKIEIYKGDPVIILHQFSQIWIVN